MAAQIKLKDVRLGHCLFVHTARETRGSLWTLANLPSNDTGGDSSENWKPMRVSCGRSHVNTGAAYHVKPTAMEPGQFKMKSGSSKPIEPSRASLRMTVARIIRLWELLGILVALYRYTSLQHLSTYESYTVAKRQVK